MSTSCRSSAAVALDEIDVPLVEEFIHAKLDEGKAPKSIRNYLGLLHSILDHGVKRGWCETNPVALVEKPRADGDPDIRFLTLDELEAILDATPTTPLGRIDRLVFLTAAMTGMRRGEVVALRWQDIDWSARLIRVRRNFTRGEFGTPKSRRSSRAVPLAARLADELSATTSERRYQGDGRPRLRPSRARRRPRPVEAAQALPGLRTARRRPAGPLPRPASHLRHTDGRRRRTAAGDPGVARPRRPTARPRSTPTTRPTRARAPSTPSERSADCRTADRAVETLDDVLFPQRVTRPVPNVRSHRG